MFNKESVTKAIAAFVVAIGTALATGQLPADGQAWISLISTALVAAGAIFIKPKSN